MGDTPPPPPVWRTSSRCGNGNCVAISTNGHCVLMRDTKDPASPILTFGRAQWRDFLAGIKANEFDM